MLLVSILYLIQLAWKTKIKLETKKGSKKFLDINYLLWNLKLCELWAYFWAVEADKRLENSSDIMPHILENLLKWYK